MRVEFEKINKEHQEIYPRLEALLLSLTKFKNEMDNQKFLQELEVLLIYVSEILEQHFREEEKSFFVLLQSFDRERLMADHEDIRSKYSKLREHYLDLQKQSKFDDFVQKDLKESSLYPAYNLIASITHHAQREDNLICQTKPKSPKSLESPPKLLL